MPAFIDLTGQVFSSLTVISREPSKNGATRWKCTCECGNTVIVHAGALRKLHTKSCGCRRKKVTTKRNLKHGLTFRGVRPPPEYTTWQDMRRRCYNPERWNFKYYGGRGITVCDRWKKFENFITDMGRKPSAKHSIDRIDNDGNYEPDNCRWATQTEQVNNRR